MYYYFIKKLPGFEINKMRTNNGYLFSVNVAIVYSGCSMGPQSKPRATSWYALYFILHFCCHGRGCVEIEIDISSHLTFNPLFIKTKLVWKNWLINLLGFLALHWSSLTMELL